MIFLFLVHIISITIPINDGMYFNGSVQSGDVLSIHSNQNNIIYLFLDSISFIEIHSQNKNFSEYSYNDNIFVGLDLGTTDLTIVCNGSIFQSITYEIWNIPRYEFVFL